jgi:hypothetical protein
VIAVLAAGIISAKRVVDNAKLLSAQALTKGLPIKYVIPDLVMWLEPTLDGAIVGASSGNNVSDGEKVASWSGTSENKITLSQGTTNNQPTYVASGINNLPSIRFNGSSGILYTTNSPIAQGSNRYTIITVWRLLSLSQGIIFEQHNNNVSIDRSAAVYVNTNILLFTGGSNQTGSLGAVAANTNYINIMVVNNADSSGNISSYLNSNTKVQTNSATTSALNLASGLLSIGARAINTSRYSFYSNSLISEIIVFNRDLKPAEVSMINDYLSKKYNITVS